jgi:hypothetical protein
MDLELLPAELAICRLGPDEQIPPWASHREGTGAGLVAVVRTGEELSIVCEAASMPDGLDCSRGWRAIRVAGTLDLSLTGVLARLLQPLADAEVPIFALSSFDTDYVLVPGERLEQARNALSAAGHRVS